MTAILVLDTVGNVVRLVFYSLYDGPPMFVTGQVEPANRLGIVSSAIPLCGNYGSTIGICRNTPVYLGEHLWELHYSFPVGDAGGCVQF